MDGSWGCGGGGAFGGRNGLIFLYKAPVILSGYRIDFVAYLV